MDLAGWEPMVSSNVHQMLDHFVPFVCGHVHLQNFKVIKFTSYLRVTLFMDIQIKY